MRKLKLTLPKGSLEAATSELFRGAFYRIAGQERTYRPAINDPEIELKILRPQEIPVYVAGVNRGMYRLAGEEASGLHVHPLHTVRYLREVMEPEVSKGLATSKRERKDISIAASVFAAVGDDESQIRSVREAYRSQIAFYASTRTYRKLLELHGWGDVGDRLHLHSVRGEWDKMGAEITQDILDEFVVEGTWSEMGRRIKERYGGTLDRVRLYIPFDGSPSWKTLVQGFRA